MNYKKIFKRETRVIVYVVIALTLIVIGTSYALFLQVNNNRNNQVVTAGSLVVEYSGGNTIQVNENDQNNCLVPQSDSTGSSTGGCRFSLSITNTGTLPMQYDLLIYNNVEEAPNGAEFVDHSFVRHSLKKQYSNEETAETITNAKSLSELDKNKDSKNILENSVIQVGETITFYLNVWISEESPVEIIGKYVYLKLDVVGSVLETETLANYLTNLSKNDSSIEKVEHDATEQTPILTDYRYVGKNPDNYVYFGCSDNCTEENLYRIIGVIPTQSSEDGSYENRVKLIKAQYYTEEISGLLSQSNGTLLPAGGSGKGYHWNSSAINNWEESTLQSKVLNEIYWDSLGSYQKYIEKSKWYLGSTILEDSSYANMTSELFYNQERSRMQSFSKGAISFIENIGLMYPSDYGYSVGVEYKDQPITSESTNLTNSWIYNLENKYHEWLITPESTHSSVPVTYIAPESLVRLANADAIFGIRPTFYLKSGVIFSGGSGTIDDPYKINI